MPEQLEPHRLTDNELLGWLVVEAYRRIQERDGVRLLLHPWPPCPVCGVRTTGRTMSASLATLDTTMVLEPCGHALIAADVAIAGLWETAEINARHVANVEAAIGQAPSRADSQSDPLALLLDQFTATAVQAARAMRADRSDETRTAHKTIAAVWTQAAHLLSQAIKQANNSGTAPHDPAGDDPSRRRALARNAVAPVLNFHDRWLPLSVREAVADAVLAAADEEADTILDQRIHDAVSQAAPGAAASGGADAALARVQALHVPVETTAGRVCAGCMKSDDPFEAFQWPCPTLAAIDDPETQT